MRNISLLSFTVALIGLPLTSCSRESNEVNVADLHNAFFTAIAAHCGQAFEGRLASTDEADADFAEQSMVMHVRDCSDTELRIPFSVGDNRSRTWVITKLDDGGLRLKREHRHEDGTEDDLSMYGGDTISAGSASRQEFPADAFSKEMFVAGGLDVSIDNIWSVEIREGKQFAYELRRPNRFFRVEFDLSNEAELPPAPWGSE